MGILPRHTVATMPWKQLNEWCSTSLKMVSGKNTKLCLRENLGVLCTFFPSSKFSSFLLHMGRFAKNDHYHPDNFEKQTTGGKKTLKCKISDLQGAGLLASYLLRWMKRIFLDVLSLSVWWSAWQERCHVAACNRLFLHLQEIHSTLKQKINHTHIESLTMIRSAHSPYSWGEKKLCCFVLLAWTPFRNL